MKPEEPVPLSVISGCVWAVIGFLVAYFADLRSTTAFEAGRTVLGGIVVAPAIGVLMGATSRSFEWSPVFLRVAIAGVTLYGAAFLFVLASGLVSGLMSGRIPDALFFNSMAATWAALTWTGFFVVLWPLAYFNHSLISKAWARRTAVKDGAIAG